MKQEEFKWVKQDLLPLFGLSDFVEKEENGFFSLPLSKENLIRNLIRITQKPKSVIEGELEDFEKNFDDYIEIKEGTYSYRTGCTIRNHPPSRSPCPTPEKSTIYYILKSELVSASRNELEKLDSEPEKIFNDIISRVQTIEDLIYISLHKYITEKCLLHDYYPFESDANSDLKEIMEIANIDKEIIEYALNYNSPFVLDYEKMNTFLPTDPKYFAAFYSHEFNTSSCRRINNISIKKEIAQYIYKKLEKIHIIEDMKRLYKELKQQIIVNEERLPLFDYKDYRFKFIGKYYSRLTKGIEKLYEFEIDDEDLRKALKFLGDKGIVEIKDDEIILLSKDKFVALYNDLIERENQRINKNKKELLIRWLISSASLELLGTGAKDTKPKDKRPENQKIAAFNLISNFEKKFREFVIAQLKNRYGQKWWKQGIKEDIKEKCQYRLNKDLNEKIPQSDISDYVDFMDLYFLIEWKQNKHIFQPYFPQSLFRLKTRLTELYNIRNVIMHSRREITEAEISTIKLYVKDILVWMNENKAGNIAKSKTSFKP